ncbi:thioether cross-link-forming SCIFF peptide maturase [Maricurvus nonylphenolicus]|uniref:quinohemoprotein amine dehydrogenase maturation protein n=1 Tax=Maricurvus nonylphenolicus TaxID=1008307 RepID=UPI0036F2CEAB
MNSIVRTVANNSHRFTVDDREMLFHVPTSGLFELDAVSSHILEACDNPQGESVMSLLGKLAEPCPSSEIVDTVAQLGDLKLISSDGVEAFNSEVKSLEQIPLATLVLNVNTGCNLSCSYCYKEDLDKPNNGQKMSFETAKQSIEMMLTESPDQPRYNIVFFGGEPLSNMPLIRDVVSYAEKRFAEINRPIDFSLTTNATMLTEEIVAYLNEHRIGVAISIDGPKAVHDKNRITVSGQGTYDVVRRKIEMLMQGYSARPIGARVTLTKGVTDIENIWDHLFNELGFSEVGFAPVTSGDISYYNLSEQELEAVFSNMKALGRRYIDAAAKGQSIGFSNMHQMLTDIHEGTKKALPCGAGAGMVAIDHSGGVNLCHRFTGSDLPLFGSVSEGLDREALTGFLETRMDRTDKGCNTCWIRNLCSGGCYHESYARYSDPQKPVYHYCDLMRDWIDFGLKAYSEITQANPDFMDTYIAPRRG